MSIHPSLASSDKNKKQRSVLKRTERMRTMFEKEEWKEGDDVYGLPKIKTLRIKIKKEKAEKAKITAATEGADGAAAPASAATKTQSPAGAKSPAAAKGQAKK